MPQSAEPSSATPSASSPPRLLRTKLLIPQTHPDLVPRSRLLSRLDEGLHCPLSLVSAGAGFGKTTLLTTWITSRDLPAAWVSLDERDNDPTRFWAYVIAALQTRRPDVGATAMAMLQSPQPPPIEGVITELLNDLAIQDERLVLILDDYHAITDEEIHHGISDLIDNLPPQLRLVLAGRADPPFPLASYRARRKLAEIRDVDLRFTEREAAAFFIDVMGLALDTSAVTTIEDLVEGWAAGLQLAALSLQEVGDVEAFVKAFSGSHRYVFDYLAHEIFHRQPPDLQRFLLCTAPLQQLQGDLCTAVTGCQESRARLEALDAANLFIIPLDRQRRWYRYHHLFADFLRAVMQETLSAAEIRGLHERAGCWYAQQGELDDAIRHALAAQRMETAADLVRQAAEERFLHSELHTVLGWLDALPADLVAQDTYLSMVGAWATLALGRSDATAAYVDAAEQAIRAADAGGAPQASQEARGALAEVALIRATLAFNQMDLTQAKSLARQAQEALAEGRDGIVSTHRSLLGIAAFDLAIASEFSGETEAAIEAFTEANQLLDQDRNDHLLPMSVSHLAQLQMLQGRLHTAAATYRAACDVALQGAARSPLSGLAFTGLGTLLYEWNDLPAAEAHLRQGLDLGRRWAEWEILLAGYAGLIRIALARGELERAQEIVTSCAAEAERTAVTWTASVIEGLRVLPALHGGDLAVAARWAAGSDHLRTGPVPYPLEPYALLLARVHVALDDPERGLEAIANVLPALRKGGRQGRVIEARATEAMALDKLGERAAALDALAEALRLAEPGGYVRTFLDAGEPMIALLRAVDILPSYVAGLPAAAAAGAGPQPTTARDTAPPAGAQAAPADSQAAPAEPQAATPLCDPLTDRELDVLRLMADGLTNQAIADRLFISINTVKTHARHIYEKLGVRNRAQATRKATTHRLLD